MRHPFPFFFESGPDELADTHSSGCVFDLVSDMTPVLNPVALATIELATPGLTPAAIAELPLFDATAAEGCPKSSSLSEMYVRVFIIAIGTVTKIIKDNFC